MRTSRLSIRMWLVLAAALAALASAPVVTIDYKTHESLWRAQRNIVAAYENSEKAPESGKAGTAEHVRKAQKLLLEADRELQLAAEPPREPR